MEPMIHQPVLLQAVLRLIDPQPGEVYLDLTAGYGGHARAISARLGRDQSIVLVDQDAAAIRELKKQFPSARILHSSFEVACQKLVGEGFKANLILMDLGLSSAQLADGSRGFSFRLDGPLDMRMDQRLKLTAADLVNRASKPELVDLLRSYSGERFADRIATSLISQRPIQTTGQLAAAVRAVVPRMGRIDPATRTFQALRLKVNDELGQLERSLPLVEKLLQPGGRLTTITFHSLEDKIVKRFLRRQKSLKLATKKPIAGKAEDKSNPRARSSLLRVVIKQPVNLS